MKLNINSNIETAAGAEVPAANGFYFTPVGLARYIGVSTTYVYKLIERGEIKAHRLGKGKLARIRIPRQAVQEFLGDATAEDVSKAVLEVSQ